MRTEKTEVRIRISLVEPPPGVFFAVQSGRDGLFSPVLLKGKTITFDFTVRVGRRPDGAPNFLGPFAQGPPAARFVYVNSRTLAGQNDSPWTRRARIPLTAIGWELIEAATGKPGSVLEARVAGTAGAVVRFARAWTLAGG